MAHVLADASMPMAMRERAANLLGQSTDPEARTALLGNLPIAPERLQSAIAAALVRRREGADATLAGDCRRQGVGAVAPGATCHHQPGKLGLAGVSERIAALLKGLLPPMQKLIALFNRRRDGFQAAKADPGLGAKVFEKHCAICHQLGGKGAKVGPQLDGIGSRGLDRLMEDILDPNRNVDQTLALTNLALKNGQIVSGLLIREEGEVLIVVDSQGKEVRVPKSSVEERIDLSAVADAREPDRSDLPRTISIG